MFCMRIVCFNIIMSQESGSRFSNNTYNPPPSFYNAPNTSPNQNSYTDPSTSQSSAPNDLLKQPLFTITHAQGYESSTPGVNSFEMLLGRYSPQQRTRMKNDNAQRYNISPDSIIYRYPSVFYYAMANKYPAEFPSTMLEDLTRNVKQIQSGQQFYNKMFFGGMLYWAVFRRATWFKLTGNGFMRVGYMLVCFNHIMQKKMEQADFITKHVFANHRQFENVINKYNIAPPNPMEL